jgi:hypothetical protein
VNGYLPVGDRRREVASQTFTSTSSTTSTSTSLSNGSSITTPANIRFQGNNLWFDLPTASTLTTTTTTRNQINRFTRALDEVSLGGFDAEAGVKIAQLGLGSDVRSYLGLYYYSGKGVSGFVGVRGRLALRLNDTVTAGLAVQGDREFGTTAVATVSLQFPNTSRKPTGQPADQWVRMGDSTVRNQAVAVTERTSTRMTTTETVQSSTQTVVSDSGGAVVAQNPTTGQPWVFQHVVLGGTAGTGTFENPFATVAAGIAAAPGGTGNDIVYVQTGTNPNILPFIIKDGVQVLSTGPVQTLATAQVGDVTLPLSGAGTLPNVTGTVTMGNTTTLGGFRIGGFVGSGVAATGRCDVIIQDNVITNLAGANGVNLDGNLTGAITVRRNTIGIGVGVGINVFPNQAVAGSLTINVANNTVQNTTNNGIQLFSTGNTQATATLANNIVTNATRFGLVAAAFGSSQLRVVIDNNQVSNTQVGGLQVGISAEAINVGQIFASITNNRVANTNAYSGFDFVEYKVQANNAGGSACARFLNNTASNSGYVAATLAATAIVRVEPFVGNVGIRRADIGSITNVVAGLCGF